MDEHDLERRRACTRWLNWHGDRTAAEQLASLPAQVAPDVYGQGGVVAELEAEVASLLGKPAAAFFVSGTMAQQIALRVHADRRGHRTVGFHPTCHLDLHELGAFERLHGLHGRTLGDRHELITLADLERTAEPLAALLLELPQRELGGRLPPWEELLAQAEWARAGGTALHLDGARLWQCPPAYERTLPEITALFETVYVSFYKDLGAITGSCLLGESDLIAEAREWRHRHGGTLFGMWPYAASCLAALRTRWPRMPAYRAHALAVADALKDLDGVRVVPDPPHTSLFHIHLRVSEAALTRGVQRIAEQQRIWTWKASAATAHPEWRVVELTVGDGTLGFTPDEVRALLAELVREL